MDTSPVTTPATWRLRVGTGIVLGLIGTLWLVVFHGLVAIGGQSQPPFALHWLLLATIALPPTCLLSIACGALARRITRDGEIASLRAAYVTLCASATAILIGVLAPLDQWMFKGSGHHHAQQLSPLAHIGRETLIALAVILPAALLVTSRSFRVPRIVIPSWAIPSSRNLTFAGAALALGAALVLAPSDLNPLGQATAANTVGNPCPAGAALKHFDVSAIDVDITLNRFGDHDPLGHMYVLNGDIPAVRAQEASKQVSVGMNDNDAIQPLVIRANMGECVEIAFTNKLGSNQPVGLHIDGLAYKADSSGDAVGRNPDSNTGPGQTRTYMYYVPKVASLEGARYLHPGPANRDLVNHGLFGAFMVEPEGSAYLNARTRDPLASGWEAIIVPGQGKAFREFATILHEIGDEQYRIKNKAGGDVPFIDPHTTAYRPDARAINYRSEPFYNRLEAAPNQESLGYSSYAFADPATTIPRSYLGDPTKIRLLHAGSEVFHVYHLHGGGIRWRANPHGDPTFHYGDTGLSKTPVVHSASDRLDAQAVGPGESYDLEIEGGAGGVQQGAGEFLWHCHIGEHYIGGMWSIWRTFDTLQPDLAPLPDRAAPPMPVDSRGLIGRSFNGSPTLTAQNVDQWIRPQLPPQGVSSSNQDAQVLNWAIDQTPQGPLYLNEPEDTTPWPNNFNENPTHPTARRSDVFVGNRAEILFNPINGRPAFPLLRTHFGKRPPFSPNGHSGAPWLGETAMKAPGAAVDPWANRPDGLCPSTAPVRKFNIVALETPIQVTRTQTDPIGRIFVLAKEKQAILDGTKPKEPLAIRANIGDCAAVTLTSDLKDGSISNFDKVNLHIHHVQFDTQASDGVITGYEYEMSIRPYKAEDPQLVDAANAGATTLHLASVAKFHLGAAIAVGEGLDAIEIHRITGIDAATNTLTINTPLVGDHLAGEYAGVEFVQERWYPDVALDNIFWHDHVDGIHNWGHGLVGQFIIEPKGSTYHDPTTGAVADSGTIVDIHTNPTSDPATKLAPGILDSSYREFAVWPIDDTPITDSTLNLKAEPWADRATVPNDPSLRFSSYKWGDPITPLPKAYPGDPFVVRSITVNASVDTLHFDGLRAVDETRLLGPDGKRAGSPVDTVHAGISERHTLIIDGGAGGPNHVPGDYLYWNGLARRFRQGAWGILRVLPGAVNDLQPLPDRAVPAPAGPLPTQTGGRPPAPTGAGNPCTAGAPVHHFDVTALDLSSHGGLPSSSRVQAIFVPTAKESAITSGQMRPEPLVLHVAEGECVEVNLTNHRAADRVSFNVTKVLRDTESSGINAGFNPEQTIAPGATRMYRYFADTQKLGGTLISDFGGDDTGNIGLYGGLVVSPAGSTFTDPVTGGATDVGAKVDVHAPNGQSHRDFTVIFSDDEPQIGASFMPYPTSVSKQALINYESAPRPDNATGFSSLTNGDPPTPLLGAYAGDPVRVHALGAAGNEQIQSFTLGGMSFPWDPNEPNSLQLTHMAVGPMEAFNAVVTGGAGGTAHSVQDYAYGTGRAPFTQAGMWGLFRSMSDASCPIKPLDGLTCLGTPPVGDGGGTTPPPPSPGSNSGPGPNSGLGGGSTSGTSHKSSLKITTRLGKSSSRQGAANSFIVTVTNPNATQVKLARIRVCLPKGFQIIGRSMAGNLRKAPTAGRCGSGRKSIQLTWNAVQVPASGRLRFSFKVRTGRTAGTLLGSVAAKAEDGFAVTPATTRIRVLGAKKH